MTVSFERLKAKMLSDPAVAAEYARLGPEFETARMLIEARARAKLSQADVAGRMGTTQSTIARLESGRVTPTVSTLRRYAEATGTRLKIVLEATEYVSLRQLPKTGRSKR